MAPPSSQSPASARRARCARSAVAWILVVAPLGLAGCTRTIDVAKVHDPAWVATTIPYTGVREPTRQFPDYSSIDASILSQEGSSQKPAPKKGSPR